MSLITVSDLTLGYESNIIAQGISFSLNEGDYLCIIGENGSGKTTLMKTLLDLQAPMSGEITFGDGVKKNEIGYMPQQTFVQRDFPASVMEIVMSGFQGKKGLRPFYSRSDRKQAREYLSYLGISELEGKSYRELSGGQQQRVLLARALCATGKILLLDEPVSGLDPKVTLEMYEIIEKLNREGTAIIMISHDIDAAAHYASHILHIGSAVFFGTKEDYMESDTGKYFLGLKREEEGR